MVDAVELAIAAGAPTTPSVDRRRGAVVEDVGPGREALQVRPLGARRDFAQVVDVMALRDLASVSSDPCEAVDVLALAAPPGFEHDLPVPALRAGARPDPARAQLWAVTRRLRRS